MSRPLIAATLLLTCILLSPGRSHGQGFERDEDFVLKPDEQALASEATALVRQHSRRLSVQGPGKASYAVRIITTILEAGGRDYATLTLGYDRMHRLKSITGEIRNSQGKLVRKLRGSEIKDYSATADYSLYDDNRVRVAELLHDNYPFTVVFDYEYEFDGIINWPTWYPQEDDRPVVRSEYEVTYPASMQVRHYSQGTRFEPARSESAGRVTLRWNAGPLAAWEHEPYGPSAGEQLPAVFIVPDRFEVAGTAGTTTSWKDLGNWYYSLSEGRWDLPEPVRNQVDSLTKGLSTDLEKTKALYQYLQSTTRYVSVQLGIGGWQPYDAMYVGTKRYGDCKALVNYMKALLRQAGIKSWPALISNGFDGPDVSADYPSLDFNHVILNVPLEADTLWLECTSQTSPFGHIGASNEGKNVLVVIPAGSHLARTPVSKPEDNLQVRVSNVEVSEEGHAVAEMTTTYTGNQQDRIREELVSASGEDRMRWVHDALGIAALDIMAAGFDDLARRSPEVQIPLKLKIPRYASKTGTRLFLTPMLAERAGEPPPAVEKRTQPVRIAYTYRDVDSVYYTLPPGFKIEAAPKPVAVSTGFGRFESSTTMLPDGRMLFHRLLEMTRTTIPPEDYEAFRTFRRQIMQADKAQVVLVRATTP